MSSLRLALKQSLQENPALSSSHKRRRRKKDVKIRDGTITLHNEAIGSSGLSSSSSSDSDSDSDSSSDSSSSSSSDSSSSSESSDEAEREAKELFDADLSSDDDRDRDSKDDNKSQKKRDKKEDKAANTIQNHWKKKVQSQQQQRPTYKRNSSTGTSSSTTPRPNKTVQPPTPSIISHIRSLSEKKQRKSITSGLRVKVRFVKKSHHQGRLIRKLKWYGGVISSVSSSGKKIRIKYDDGTDEVAVFPDKDIVVDDVGNGVHEGDALVFIPEEEEEGDGDGDSDGSISEDGNVKKFHSGQISSNLDSDHSVQREKHSKEEKMLRPTSSTEEKTVEDDHDASIQQNEEKKGGDASNNESRQESQMSPKSSPLPEKSHDNKKVVATLPSPPLEEDKAPSSSSSGSTCSSTSFGVIADNAKANQSHSVVVVEAAKTNTTQETTTSNQEEKNSSPVKKHRPLSIKISLPKRKRPEEEGKATTPAPALEEPVKKKVKHVDGDVPKTAADDDAKKEQESSDVVAAKPLNDDSDPNKKEESIDVKPTPKPVDSSQDPPKKKPKLSIHISKKKIKAAEEAAAGVVDSSKVPSAEGSKPPSSPEPVEDKVPPVTGDTKPAEPDAKNKAVESESKSVDKVEPDAAAKDNAEPDATEKEEVPAEMPKKDVDPIKDATHNEEPSTKDKQPVSAVEKGANPAVVEKSDEPKEEKPAPEAFPRDDDERHAYSLERSGRKAAKEAAEKLKGKKNKRRGKPDKTTAKAAEEDPWVQCDRCHKWRHLPDTVNVNSLPEHWFCELNTYDEKHNTCDAPEQTPKDVAKEKKRIKKLALKKLQMEEAEAQGEWDGKTSLKEGEEGGLKRKRSTSPDPNDVRDDDNVGSESPKAAKPKRKPGRPRNEDRVKAKEEKGGKDDKKQEWVQCEKCEKWRRLPPRIKADDLPDVWFCSMNTWDINLATCTAIEDKIEPQTKETFNVQSQIPLSSGSSGKLSYRNLIFGNGRRQKNVSERMRAQESLFSITNEAEGDMSTPTVMYASSDAFSSGKQKSHDDQEEEETKPSIFDTLVQSRVWNELNNGLVELEWHNKAAYNSVGFPRYCNPDGSLKAEAIDNLKTMVYFALTNKVLANHELLLEIQCRHWKYVPRIWLELRAICTIEIVNYILDLLMRDGLVQQLQDSSSAKPLDEFYYRITPDPDQEELQSDIVEEKSTCLKIRKPWK